MIHGFFAMNNHLYNLILMGLLRWSVALGTTCRFVDHKIQGNVMGPQIGTIGKFHWVCTSSCIVKLSNHEKSLVLLLLTMLFQSKTKASIWYLFIQAMN